MNNKVSVVVPMYNSSKHIEKCLDGILNQTLKDLEVVLVDDCSTDDTISKAEKYPFKIIKLKENSRVSKARNCGVENTSGEIIIFVDADVVLAPDSIEMVISNMSKPDTDVVCGNYTADIPKANFFSQFLNLFVVYRYSHPPEFVNFIFSCFFAIKRTAYKSVEGFNEEMFYYEDVEIGYKLTKRGYHIRLNPIIEVTHLKQYTHLSLICDWFRKTSSAGAFYRRVGFSQAPKVDTLPLPLKIASAAVMISLFSVCLIKISLIPLLLFLFIYSISIVPFVFYIMKIRNFIFSLVAFCFCFEFMAVSEFAFIWGFLKNNKKNG